MSKTHLFRVVLRVWRADFGDLAVNYFDFPFFLPFDGQTLSFFSTSSPQTPQRGFLTLSSRFGHPLLIPDINQLKLTHHEVVLALISPLSVSRNRQNRV